MFGAPVGALPMFALAAAGLLLTAGLLASALRLRSPTSFLLATYLIGAAEIVGLTEILSLLGSVGSVGYAIGEGLVGVAAAGVWLRRGRPAPPPFPRLDRATLRRHPALTGLAVVVALALVYEVVLVVSTPPNNWDSMTYHLTRVVEWSQRDAVEYYPTHTERQNAFQPNAEILALYSFSFLGRDTLAGAPQFLAGFGLLLAVYGTARRLGSGRPAALFASLLTATLTEVALQSVTTQNDLLVASFVAAAAYFVLSEARWEIALAALAIGLGVGTKLTAALALPLLAGLALAARPRLTSARLAVASVLAVLAVGSYGYWLNIAETGKPLGRAAETEALRPEITVAGTASTAVRIVYRFLDFSGFHAPADWLSPFAAAGVRGFRWLGIPQNPEESTAEVFGFQPNSAVHEDFSFFGPLGVLLILPLTVVVLVAWARHREGRVAGVLAFAIPLYVLELAFLYRYNSWIGRFMLTPVALTMPLAARFYRRRWLAAGLALVGAVTLGLAHSYNAAKPVGLDGTTPVWSLSHVAAQTLLQGDMREVFETVEERIPSDARVGAILGPDDWSYPLYGDGLDRELVYLSGRGALRQAERLGLPWVAIGEGAAVPAGLSRLPSIRFDEAGWFLVGLGVERVAPSGNAED